MRMSRAQQRLFDIISLFERFAQPEQVFFGAAADHVVHMHCDPNIPFGMYEDSHNGDAFQESELFQTVGDMLVPDLWGITQAVKGFHEASENVESLSIGFFRKK